MTGPSTVERGDIAAVYAPLAARLGARFLATEPPPVPVVALVGGVAVGKSTSAAVLAAQLRMLPGAPRVEVVATDGFLLTNAELAARGLELRKGFPETYDVAALVAFLEAVRGGMPSIEVPRYSHERYDVVAGEHQTVTEPRILVIEGLGLTRPELARLLDFVVYLDADEVDAYRWYIERFLAMFPARLRPLADQAWSDINLVNLREFVVPARAHADVVLEKGPDHVVRRVVSRPGGRDTMGG
jgi:type I pantothenate kinase